MGLRARRELLRSVNSRYRVADRKNKQRILDEFVTATCYHRKYAVTILVQTAKPSDSVERKPRSRPRRYTDDENDSHLCHIAHKYESFSSPPYTLCFDILGLSVYSTPRISKCDQ
jgi:hypothetical protein